MNLDELTIGQARELSRLFGTEERGSILSSAVGEYVIVRSRNEGINAGVVEALDATGVVITEARRIWWHKPADIGQAWYEGLANSGLSADSKVSSVVVRKRIVENYSLTSCSKVAEESIREHVSHGS